MSYPPSLLLAAARLAATRAGDFASSQSARRRDVNTITRHDIKHKLDVESEALATRTLLQAFPDSSILGEETNQVRGIPPPPPQGVEWIIDPIDGTINFYHGLPFWNCSIAARVNGVIVAGVVYAPELRYCFEATIDGPALLNGVPIHPSDEANLIACTVHTGADRSEDPRRGNRFFNAIAEICQRPRVMGSAALDICAVAVGMADAYFENGVYIWDVAAAGLIASRAGATAEVVKNHEGYRLAFLATNGQPTVHDPLLRTISALLG